MNNPHGNNSLSPFVTGAVPAAHYSAARPAHLAAGRVPRGEKAQSLSARFVLAAMRRWWKVAAPVGLLLAAAGGALVYMSFEPVWQASAWLRIESKTPYIAFPDRDASRQFVTNQTELIRSPMVLDPVVSDPAVARVPEVAEQIAGQRDPTAWLAKQVKIQSVGGSELFTVSIAAAAPSDAEKIVEAIVRSYFAVVGQQDAERTQRVIELLQEEKERRRLEVDQQRNLVRKLTEEATGKDPFAAAPEAAAALPNPWVQVQVDLSRAQAQRRYWESEVQAFEEIRFGLGELRLEQNAQGGSWRAALPGGQGEIALKPTGTTGSADLPRIALSARHAVGDQAMATATADEQGAVTVTVDVDPAGTTAGTLAAELQRTLKGEFEVSLGGGADPATAASQPVAKLAEVPDGVIRVAVENHADIARIKGEVAAAEARLAEYRQKLVLPEDDPLFQRAKNDLANLQQALEERQADLREPTRKNLSTAAMTQYKLELEAKVAELQKARWDEKAQLEQWEKVKAEQKALGGETLELEFARADLARADGVHKIIADRILALQTEQRAPGRIALMRGAKASTTPVQSFPVKQVLLVMLAGLCAPFGLAVGWEWLARRVSDARQIEEDANLAVVGEIARLPLRVSGRGALGPGRAGRDLALFEESIDSLRTCLLLSEPLKDMKVLTVTSAANSEGKTSVAVQLAVSIARASGRRTLLIDGDMRAPDIHKVLGLPLAPGLAEVLARQCTLEEAIRTEFSEYVHVLPAGVAQASPHKLLGNGTLKPLLEKVRASYHYVVIDTPPILAAAEALVLAKHADAALICAMKDVSRMDQVRRTCERLLAAEARPVGVVLNGVPAHGYAYRYGSYRYARR